MISTLYDRLSSLMKTRKAQFFIITVVLVAGSLSITMNVLEDYQAIQYDEASSTVAVSQFQSISRSFDSLWYSEDWSFRRELSADVRGGIELNRFPVSAVINTSKLIKQGKMRSSCQDLRIGRGERQIPFQIEPDTCGTGETKIWFLYTEGEPYHMYYGNDNVEKPSYNTELNWNPRENALENDLITIEAETTSSGKGFIELRRKGEDNLVESGFVVARGSSSDEIKTIEEGPIYTTINFSDNRYRLFASNAFLRRENQTELSTSDPIWYSSDSSVMSHWEAGNSSNQKEIDGDGWPGSIETSGIDLPYVAALKPGEESLAMTTDTKDLDNEIDEYIGQASGGDFYFGLGSSEGTVEAPYLDFILGRSGVSRSQIRTHSEPPTIETLAEEKGSFKLSDGWSTKKRVSIEEVTGSYLPNHPINLSLNLGEMEMQEDCSNLVVTEDGVVRPHVVKGRCDSLDYTEPADFTARFPFDRGTGDKFNSSGGVFDGRIVNDGKWVAGRFGLGLSLEKEDSAVVERSPRIELKNGSFTISLWLKANFTAQDYGQTVGIVEYPDSTPSLHAVEDGEDIVLEGRFRNESRGLNTVQGNDDLSSLPQRWHHIVMVYNNSNSRISLFVNGELDSSGEVKGDLALEEDRIEIGNGLKGDIDELKFYQDSLETDEILDQYDTSTDITFLANLTAGEVNRDVEIFGGAPAGLSDDSSEVFSDMKARSIDAVVDPEASVSQNLRYRDLASTMKDRFGESSDIGTSLDVDIRRGCSMLSFDDGQFSFNKKVC